MIKKTIYILIFLLAVCGTNSLAQNSQAMYFMNLPQNHLLNPALRPSNSVYVGLPVMTGFNISLNNNFVNFSDVLIKGQPKDSIISFLHPGYDVNKFLSKIKDKNFLETESFIQLLGIGVAIGNDGYFFLDINDRIESNIVLPGDLIRLALKGNEGFVGSKIDLSSLRADVQYYREFGLGFSRNVTDKLRIGVKGKLLFGIAGSSIDNRSMGITVNDDYSQILDANMTVNMSGPVSVNTGSGFTFNNLVFNNQNPFNTSSGAINFLSGMKNNGFGLDLGATYDVTDRLVVSAAVTDLGFIRWKKDVTNLTIDNQFVFTGIDLTDYLNGSKTIDQIGQNLVDSIKNKFVVSSTRKAYTTYLPFGFSVGGSYSITKQFSVGILSYSRVISKQVREALTLSANLNLGNSLSTTLSYTAENNQYDNLGAGIAFRAGIAQFYLVTDRIPVTWNRITGEKTTTGNSGQDQTHNYNVLIPANWNTFNIRLGMNLVFGNKPKEKNDKPMIMIE